MPKVQLLRTQKEISLKLPLTKMSLMKSKGLICVSAHIYMRTIHSLQQLNGLLSKEKALQKKTACNPWILMFIFHGWSWNTPKISHFSLALFCLLLMGAADYFAHFHLNLTRSDVHARLDDAARKLEVRMNDAGYWLRCNFLNENKEINAALLIYYLRLPSNLTLPTLTLKGWGLGK